MYKLKRNEDIEGFVVQLADVVFEITQGKDVQNFLHNIILYRDINGKQISGKIVSLDKIIGVSLSDSSNSLKTNTFSLHSFR